MGHTGLGRELERLLPVKNLLPSNVSLERGVGLNTGNVDGATD